MGISIQSITKCDSDHCRVEETLKVERGIDPWVYRNPRSIFIRVDRVSGIGSSRYFCQECYDELKA